MELQSIQEHLTGNETSPISAFSTTYVPADNTLLTYVNGSYQSPTVDYNINGNNLTFNSLIPAGDNVNAVYSYSVPTEFNIASNTVSIQAEGDEVVSCPNTETILPSGTKGSTTLNHVVTSYELLADRIKMQMGWPIVRIEICDEQIYDFINQAIEWYSKYAGHTEEYLMFSSELYNCGVGLQVDRLFSMVSQFECDNCQTPSPLTSGQFVDCDLNNYRKVVSVFSVDPVEFTGTDTLFTLDYLFAQQTYFSYMLGSFGFDLVTWHILKDWLDLRSKLFATKPYVRFDPRTQRLKLMPEPMGNDSYYGVIGCRVEQPIRHLVQERWVQRYAMALTQIALAHIRGKFGQVTLFGGGSINATDMMTQGLETKNKLEEEIMNNYGEAEPPFFFIG